MNKSKVEKKPSYNFTAVDIGILTALALITVAAIILNLIVLRVFKKKPSLLRSPTNKLLCSCACCDLVAGFVTSLHLASSLSHSLSYPQSTLSYCYRVFLDILTTFLQLSTFFHICLLTIDRYVALFFALRYKAIVNGSRVNTAISLAWVLSFVTSFVQLCWLYRVLDGEISPSDADVLDWIECRYSLFILSVFISLPLLVVMFMYCRMYCQARKLLVNPATTDQACLTKEIIVMWIFFCMALLICVNAMPYFITRLIIDLQSVMGKQTQISIYWLQLTSVFKHLVHVSNPLIYAIKKTDIREEVNKTMASLKPACSSQLWPALGKRYARKEPKPFALRIEDETSLPNGGSLTQAEILQNIPADVIEKVTCL